MDFEDTVVTGRVIGERGHPAELIPQRVQQLRGVEHLLLKAPQEIVVLLCESLGQRQSLFQVLLQRTFQRLLSRTICTREPCLTLGL